MSAAVDYGYPLHHAPPSFQFPTDNPYPSYDGHASTMGNQNAAQAFNLGFLNTTSTTPLEYNKRFSSSSTQQKHFSIPLIQQPPSPQYPPQQHLQQYHQTPRQSIDSLHVPSRKSRAFSMGSMGQQQQIQYQSDRKRSNRRSGSTSTAGTSASSTSLQRTGSDSSNHSLSPYVLMLRKQKATVWCDRSQNEDARILAAQRADKVRADREVKRASGLPASLHGSSPPHRGKIRHQQRNKHDSDYNPNMSLVAGIPARLDIGEESGDDDDSYSAPMSPGGFSAKTGSGRSSINSVSRRRYLSGPQFPTQIPTPTGSPHASGSTSNTNTSSPSSYSRASSFTAPPVQERQPSPQVSQTVVAAQPPPPIPPKAPRSPRSEQPKMNFSQPRPSPVSYHIHYSTSSKKSHLNGLKNEGLHKSDSVRVREEIQRRGSVDEMKARTRTMTGIRLFVANPDQ